VPGKKSKLVVSEQADERLSKTELAKRLGVSRGTLYYEQKLPKRDDELRQQIEEVLQEHPEYGHRRVADALGINRKRALRVMKLYGLKPTRRARSAPAKPNDTGKADSGFADILKRFSPIEPDIVWVSDFTFIRFQGRFIYLATILDHFTRVVLGKNIMLHHTSELIQEALSDALSNCNRTPEYFHSDQGSEYDSDAFLSELAHLGIQPSHCPKASPWRNGRQESFFGRFKVEFGDFERFETLSELIEAIYRHIHRYNTMRIHTAFRMPPALFRHKWYAQQKNLIGAKLTPPPAVTHSLLRRAEQRPFSEGRDNCYPAQLSSTLLEQNKESLFNVWGT